MSDTTQSTDPVLRDAMNNFREALRGGKPDGNAVHEAKNQIKDADHDVKTDVGDSVNNATN